MVKEINTGSRSTQRLITRRELLPLDLQQSREKRGVSRVKAGCRPGNGAAPALQHLLTCKKDPATIKTTVRRQQQGLSSHLYMSYCYLSKVKQHESGSPGDTVHTCLLPKKREGSKKGSIQRSKECILQEPLIITSIQNWIKS